MIIKITVIRKQSARRNFLEAIFLRTGWFIYKHIMKEFICANSFDPLGDYEFILFMIVIPAR